MFNINIPFIRTISRNKLNLIVKTLGISVSFIVLIFISIYVKNESSYDKHFHDNEKIFRLIRNWKGNEVYGISTPAPLLNALISEFPEIETGSRLLDLEDKIIICNENVYHENKILAVDSSFLQTFKLKLILGDENTALNKPGTILISRKKSLLYFKNENPLGKTLEFEGDNFNDNNKTFTISGVFEDIPQNTHFRPELLLALKSFEIYYDDSHGRHFMPTYVKLANNKDKTAIEKKFPGFIKEFYGEDFYNNSRPDYLLQPITDIHLNTSVFPYGYETSPGDAKNLVLFPLLGFLILLIACINYLNLTISEGYKNVKNFAINKISGAGKMYFFKKYFSESCILICIAVFLSVFVSYYLLPFFNSIMDRQLEFNTLWQYGIWVIIALVVILFISINTLIPSIIFSGKKAIYYISSKIGMGNKSNPFQQLSQTIQNSICIFLLICSFIVLKQLKFFHKQTNSSMNIENVLIIKNARNLKNQKWVFKQELQKIPGIKSVSLCNEVPGSADYSNWGQPVDQALEDINVAVFYCDKDYFKTLDLEITIGRFFNDEFSMDQNALVFNEAAIKRMGWNEDPLGKRYEIGKTYHVIGVVKNIHYESLKYPVFPQAFIPNFSINHGSKILVKLDSQNINENMDKIISLWNKFVPHRDIYYGFLNKEFEQWYKTERKISVFSIILSFIAVFLSNLGLLAYVLYKIQARIKEIGIRRVNGAKTSEVLVMLNIDFIKWVIIAFIISCPIAWYVMHKWLENYAYKTNISWWIFVLSGVLALGIALLIVSWQSWQAARRNPVEALRYE